jgi:rhodanese-related sulfurtransferase
MFQNISQEQYLQMIEEQDVVAIDVRTAPEYTEFQLPKSLVGFDWNSGEFYDKVEELDKSKKLIFICRSGNRSMQACMFLASNGFEYLYNLEGGVMNWN